jgi:hypothetical protein
MQRRSPVDARQHGAVAIARKVQVEQAVLAW